MNSTRPAASPLEFLAGGGEMGALMRAHDWTSTSVGAPGLWPQSLRTAVRLVLNTRHPMYIFWGPELLCFYNDAYSASIGPERHPISLGQPARVVWDEIWDVIGPQIEQVMNGLGATWHENQLIPITRNGQREQVYWTYSYGPIDESTAPSGVGGVLVVCSETTATVLAERRREQELQQQRNLFDQAPGFIIVMRGPQHQVEFVNEAHRKLFGSERWIGLHIREAFPDLAAQGFFELLDGVYTSGQTYRAHSAPARFKKQPSGIEETRLLDFVYSAIVGPDGAVEGVFCEGHDVTERARAEAALRESETRFGEVANAAPVLIWMSDAEGRHVWFNTPWLSFTGRSAASSQDDGWMKDVHPDDAEQRLATYRSASERQTRFCADYRIRRSDGEWRTLEDSGVPRFSEDGVFLGYIGSAIDVTEQRQTQAALHRSEEQLRLAIEAAEVGFWDVDPLRDVLVWPPIVKAMFGISESVPVSMSDFYAGLHPEDRQRVGEAYANAADPTRRALYDVEYRTIGKEDGRLRWVAAKGRGVFDADGRCVRMIGTAIDISARKLDEERLRQSQARLAEAVATLDGLLASAPIGFAFFDRRLAYVRVNAMLAEINQAAIEAHRGKTLDELSAIDARVLTPLLQQVIASGTTISSVEVDAQAAKARGEDRTLLAAFFPVLGVGEKVEYVGMTLVDITQRRWAEAALKRINDDLEAQVAKRTADRDRVWRNSRDLLVMADAEGFLLAVSPSWTAILGHQPDQVIGRHLDVFLWPDETETHRPLLGTRGDDNGSDFETRYRHRDGTPRWLSWRTSVEQNIVYAYGRDITAEKAREAEFKVVEEALRQAQKMEAIGQLTGGIAHDFNNLLQSVSGNLELIKRNAHKADRVLKWAESGSFAVARGAKLTAQMLAFSRSQKLELEPIDVSALLLRMRELLSRTLGPSILVDMDVAEPSITVMGDETQLEMAVLNLAINARDAMPAGGNIRIAVAKVWIGEDPQLSAGEYAAVSVKDTGPGMPHEVAARAFDPFFTTKGPGKGTGLGLSQVYGMTRQAGGVARIDTTLGFGVTVVLYMPCTDNMTGAVELKTSGDADGEKRRGLVLVVDDDDDVRHFVLDSLEGLGYSTAEASDGQAAIEAHARLQPDVVILDFAMPGMNGAEIASRLRAIDKDLPVIFASGFSETAAIERLSGPLAPTLRKPFGIDELSTTLKAAIAARLERKTG